MTLYPGTGLQRKLTYGYDATPRLTTIDAGRLAGRRAERRRDGRLHLGQGHRGCATPTTTRRRKPDARASVAYDSATQATCKRYGTVGGTAEPGHEPGGLRLERRLGRRAQPAREPDERHGRPRDHRDLQLRLRPPARRDHRLGRRPDERHLRPRPRPHELDHHHRLARGRQPDHRLRLRRPASHDERDELPEPHGLRARRPTPTPAPTSPPRRPRTRTAPCSPPRPSRYDAQGRTTQEKHLVSGTVQQRHLDADRLLELRRERRAPDDDRPGRQAEPDRRVPRTSPGRRATTPSATCSPRPTGAGARRATNTYDIAGNLLTSTDAAGVVSRTSYDCMGNATESWRTAQRHADEGRLECDELRRHGPRPHRDHEALRRERQPDHAERRHDHLRRRRQRAQRGRHDASVARRRRRPTTRAPTPPQELERGRPQLRPRPAARRAASTTPRATSPTRACPATRATPGPGATCTATTYDDAGNVLSEKQPDGTKTLRAYDGQANELAERRRPDRDQRRLPPWDDGLGLRRRRPGDERDRRPAEPRAA